MNKTELQTLLTASYRRDNWKALLLGVFHDRGASVIFDANPAQVLPSTKAAEYRTTNLYRLGDLTLADGKTIALFEAEVQNTRIAQNRVGLRSLVAREIVPNFQDGAFAVFYSQEEREWRFSFITKYEEWDTQTGLLQKVETAPKRYTYLFGSPQQTHRTAIGRLLRLHESPKILQDVFDAFSVAKLSKEFFDEYKKRYQGFCSYLYAAEGYRSAVFGLTGDEDDPTRQRKEKAIRDFVKKMLGRLVFLNFVQKKGWMGVPADSPEGDWSGGESNFLQRLFEQAPEPERFHSQILERLFYQTLNTRRPNHHFDAPWGSVKVPYLNGGLFDNDFQKGNSVDFPHELFSDLFAFFNQYNFTIDENRGDEHEVGIDPEMLGHIFENLLEDNKDKGAYYTPKEVVHYMCQESLLQYLQSNSSDAPAGFMEALVRNKNIAERDWLLRLRQGKTNGERLETLLDAVKICDPAIGSGAFPMGMLHEIFDLKLLLDATLNPAKTKQQIIQNSIYGVDIDRGAVDIARLRFWLSLVVDEDQPQPLPNLDYKIMQGNSLLESFEGIDLSQIIADETDEKPLTKPVQGSLFAPTGQQTLLRFEGKERDNLVRLMNRFFGMTDKEEKETVHAKIEEKVSVALDNAIRKTKLELLFRQSDLKKQLDNKSYDAKKIAKIQKEIARLEAEINACEQKQIRLDEANHQPEKPWFLWNLFFKDVFDIGGFDIAIGNPPYFQIQKLPAAAKAALEAEGYDTFIKTADLYCLFYEKALRILRPGGVLAFITSNSWLKTQYGEPLRRHFTTQADPLALLNFEDAQLFKAAIVETNILLAQKGEHRDRLRAAAFGKDYLPGQPLTTYLAEKGTTVSGLGGEAWHIGDAKAVALLKKVELNCKRLKEYKVEFNLGILNGFNEAFIIDENKKNELIQKDKKSYEIIKPMLRGRDLKPYSADFSNQWLIHSHNGIKVKNIPRINVDENYPSIFEHLSKYKNQLEIRHNKGDHWANLRNCVYFMKFEEPKIMWAEISDKPKFSFDDIGYYTNNKCFILTGEKLKYLTAVLNSKIIEWYAYNTFTTTGMGTVLWMIYNVEQLPIPTPNEAAERQLTGLVERILGGKRAGEDTAAWEAEVDVLVFKLYGLGYEEATAIAPGLDAGLWEGVVLAG